MSYAVGNRQFPIRDFRRAIFDENLRGNASDFSQDFHRKSFGGNCLSLIAPHSIVLLVFDTTQYSMYRYVCMYHHTYSKSMDQPGKVANPARGQLFFFFFIFHLTYSRWTSIITILPVVTKDLPISLRFTPYNYLSRCKFSTLTTRQPMVEFYLLTFPRFPLRKKEHKSYFGKNRTHDFRTSRCAAYLLDHSGDELNRENEYFPVPVRA